MSEIVAARDAVAGRGWASRLAGYERARYALGVLVLAAVYYGAAQLGFALEVAGPVAAIVWLPVGVGIAFLYVAGIRFWPGVLVGDLLANDYVALPLGTALAQTVGNLLEVLVATWLLRRLVRRGSPLGSVGGVLGMLAALGAGTAVSATIGSLAQLAGAVITIGALPTVWRTWWLGDLTGALVIVPLALAWSRPPPRTWWSGRKLEAALVLVAVAALSELATRSHDPLMYLIFPALIWAALRFGQWGATPAVAIAVGFTVWNTAHYTGPFVFHTITPHVVSTQLFIAVAALTTLCLGAVVSEREAFGEGLRASRARVVEASDTERRRIVRNLHDGAQQRLTALAVHMHLAAEDDAAPEGSALFERAGSELSLVIEELRELSHGLQPTLLARLGLAGAIRDVAERATIPVTLVELPAMRIDDRSEATAYYVVAEAVANAQKHAHASSIHVRAVVAHRRLQLEVSDDGAGGAAETPGSGLQGLRDRVEAVGGTFELHSVRGRGTRVAATIPAAPAA